MIIDTKKLRDRILKREQERCKEIDKVVDDRAAMRAYTRVEEWGIKRTDLIESVETLAKEKEART